MDEQMAMYPPSTNLVQECFSFIQFDVCFGKDVLPHALLHEPVQSLTIQTCQPDAAWHLQRISSTDWPAHQPYYLYPDTLQPKTVYVVDSGIDVTHIEFENRVKEGVSFFNGPLHPHGTHVAGLVGSRKFGVSKRVQLISVRVLNEQGQGNSGVLVKAFHWLLQQPQPAIINLSLGGGFSAIVNQIIDQLSKIGWIIVVAAGNDYKDACTTSPASASTAITVGAFDKFMQFASFSNYGKCVDVLAPGVDISSTYPEGLYAVWSGTSMAAPIVSGVIANLGWIPRKETFTLLKKANLPFSVKNVPPATPNKAIFQNVNGKCPAINKLVFVYFLFQIL